MRRLIWILLIFALAAASAHASVCDTPSGDKTVQPRWRVDHYVYDASLKRDWEVLVDCDHPGAPARMKLAPKGAHALVQNAPRDISNVARAEQDSETAPHANPQPAPVVIRTGAAVEVSSAPGSPARILLSGTAMEMGRLGQHIRVRIDASGRFLQGTVRGPHSVELAAAAKPAWGKP
ncbi:MAG TPA: flagella basal body P-ring formation protein FlgA [Acidobacteriaceae bacterium]|nr:flagella basal body P-ring formation protein FlgA [Acidobacteriaceae bacterium]